MPRAGERRHLAGVTTDRDLVNEHGGNVGGSRAFIFMGDLVSPAGPMAGCALGAKVTRMLNTYATPMAWTASVMAPRSPYPEGDVTVVLRVTYNTLESIIRDEFMLTESRVAH